MAILEIVVLAAAQPGWFEQLSPIAQGVVSFFSLGAFAVWMFVQQHVLGKKVQQAAVERAEAKKDQDELVLLYRQIDDRRQKEFDVREAQRQKEFEARESERVEEFAKWRDEQLDHLKTCQEENRKMRAELLRLNRRMGMIEHPERRKSKHKPDHAQEPGPEPEPPVAHP